MNSPLYQKCLEIATKAHEGQYRNDGTTPYITHPVAVAEMVSTETEKCVALLHDVLEDTPLTWIDLDKDGIGMRIIECVEILTKVKGDNYLEYILHIKKYSKLYPEALTVKLADMEHNGQTAGKTMRDKYELAKYILTH